MGEVVTCSLRSGNLLARRFSGFLFRVGTRWLAVCTRLRSLPPLPFSSAWRRPPPIIWRRFARLLFSYVSLSLSLSLPRFLSFSLSFLAKRCAHRVTVFWLCFCFGTFHYRVSPVSRVCFCFFFKWGFNGSGPFRCVVPTWVWNRKRNTMRFDVIFLGASLILTSFLAEEVSPSFTDFSWASMVLGSGVSPPRGEIQVGLRFSGVLFFFSTLYHCDFITRMVCEFHFTSRKDKGGGALFGKRLRLAYAGPRRVIFSVRASFHCPRQCFVCSLVRFVCFLFARSVFHVFDWIWQANGRFVVIERSFLKKGDGENKTEIGSSRIRPERRMWPSINRHRLTPNFLRRLHRSAPNSERRFVPLPVKPSKTRERPRKLPCKQKKPLSKAIELILATGFLSNLLAIISEHENLNRFVLIAWQPYSIRIRVVTSTKIDDQLYWAASNSTAQSHFSYWSQLNRKSIKHVSTL